MIKNVNGEYAAFSPDDQQSIYDWGVVDERARIIHLILASSLRGEWDDTMFKRHLIGLIEEQKK